MVEKSTIKKQIIKGDKKNGTLWSIWPIPTKI
jgi:hypothetical protein